MNSVLSREIQNAAERPERPNDITCGTWSSTCGTDRYQVGTTHTIWKVREAKATQIEAGPPLRPQLLAFAQFVPSRLVATRELHTSLKVVAKLQRPLNEQVAT